IQGGAEVQAEHLGVGKAGTEAIPGGAAVRRVVHALVVADVQRAARRVELDGPGGQVGQIAADVRPRRSTVDGLEHVAAAEGADKGGGGLGGVGIGDNVGEGAGGAGQVIFGPG